MITMSEFGVSPLVAAGNIGSRDAAHAVATAAHKRNAAATDASVDRSST